MRTSLLLSAAAVGVLVSGAVAQTNQPGSGQHVERIKDAAGHSQSLSGRGDDASKNSAPQTNAGQAQKSSDPQRRNVRTVYPNTQNAEQAAQQARSARGQAEATKRQPGEVTPLTTEEQPSTATSTSAAQSPQDSPKNAPTSAQPSPPAPTAQSAQSPSPPASTAQSARSPSPPAPSAQATQSSNPPAASQAAQQPSTPSARPSNAAPSTAQGAPTATAEQSSTPAQSPQASAQSTGIVSLTTEQQTSIGRTIATHDVKPVTNVNFSIAVGTKVPTSVQLRALPSDLGTFVPQYRGYSYFVVEEQIVIVDPGAHEIVAIVPYTGAAPATRTVETGAAPPTPTVATKAAPREMTKAKPRKAVAQKPMVSRSVNLNTEQKREPRTEEKSVTRHHATEPRNSTRSASGREYRENGRAPRAVTIEEFFEPVYGAVPRPRGFFRFFGGDDDDNGYD